MTVLWPDEPYPLGAHYDAKLLPDPYAKAIEGETVVYEAHVAEARSIRVPRRV